MRSVIQTLTGALGVLLLTACSESKTPVSIVFSAVHDGAALSCDDGPDAVRLIDMRFYVHDIELQAADGSWRLLDLDAGTPWQNEDVVLIDLENGAGACRGGSAQINRAVTGVAEGGSFKGLRFTLGVPFELNHSDPVRAQSPLHLTVMHWHWQAGYKFLRAGVRDGDTCAWLHLGSTQCQGMIGAIEACRNPNRTTVTLEAFDPTADVVAIDLAHLFAGVALTAPQPRGCMSDPNDTPCAPVLVNLGVAAGAPSAPVFSRVRNG